MATYADSRQQKMETGKKIKSVLKDHRKNNMNNNNNREE